MGASFSGARQERAKAILIFAGADSHSEFANSAWKCSSLKYHSDACGHAVGLVVVAQELTIVVGADVCSTGFQRACSLTPESLLDLTNRAEWLSGEPEEFGVDYCDPSPSCAEAKQGSRKSRSSVTRSGLRRRAQVFVHGQVDPLSRQSFACVKAPSSFQKIYLRFCHALALHQMLTPG
jgi:hypothetical protein